MTNKKSTSSKQIYFVALGSQGSQTIKVGNVIINVELRNFAVSKRKMVPKLYVWFLVFVAFGIGSSHQLRLENEKYRLCGRRLMVTLQIICGSCNYHSQINEMNENSSVSRASLINDCCKSPDGCDFNFLKSFCCPDLDIENANADTSWFSNCEIKRCLDSFWCINNLGIA